MRKSTLYVLSSVLSFLPLYQVKANYLVPVSFSQMYNLAQSGEVRALRASVRRGLNIDVTNSNGDTGLCVAARNRDAYTYNAFRAAGANPRHPCVQRVEDYEDFVNSSRAVSVTSTPRDAYGKMGLEKFSLYPGTWWVLGGLAVGGGIAAVAGGGGGGGSSSGSQSLVSVADYLGQNGKISTSTNQSIVNKNNLDFSNKNQYNVSLLSLNNDLLNSVKSLDVGFKAFDGGKIYNSEDVDIQIDSGVVAMAGVNNGAVYNNGYINTEAFNASISMLASNNSQAVNNGSGIVEQTGNNGIDLNFSGYSEDNVIIGMYGDTGSTILNNGDIRGSAIQASEAPKDTTPESGGNTLEGLTLGDGIEILEKFLTAQETGQTTVQTTSSSGTIIGMQTMIINSGAGMNEVITKAENNGNIDVSAGNSSNDSEVKINIIGMGSFLDNSFLNDSKNIKRAEQSVLLNKGTISLGYTGSYTTNKENTLRKGLGGIVGMRADANTNASNFGKIKITLSNDISNTAGSIAVATGMQSVHGGNLFNEANSSIIIQTPAENARITYGMVSVEGHGNVAGLYTNMGQSLNNKGNINLNASNGFGMASYNGGTLVNTGVISIGSESNSLYNNNVGMYGSADGERVSLLNTGTINIYSHNSLAMKNDYSGDTVIENNGVVNIYRNAINSSVFGGNYSNAYNNGTINFYALSSENASEGTGSSSSGNSGLFFNKFDFSIENAAINTDGNEADSTASSNTENIYNNGTINMIGSSSAAAMKVGTTQGRAYNNNTINIKNSDIPNTVNAVGMYLYGEGLKNTEIVNNGNINIETRYSAAMASDSLTTSAVVNNSKGVINVYGIKSFGMYASGNSYLYNKGIINLYGDDGVAFYSRGDGSGAETSFISNNLVNVYGDNATIFVIEGKAIIENMGTINICSSNSGDDCAPTAKDTIRYFYIDNDVSINLIKTIYGGVFAEVGENGKLTNAQGNILSAEKGILFKGSGGESINDGIMNLNGKDTIAMLSVEDSGNKIYNNETININENAENGIGIKVMKGGEAINVGEKQIKAIINVFAENAYGVYMDNGSSSFENQALATINVYANNSYGIFADDASGDVKNNGIINVGILKDITENGAVEGSYGVYVGRNVTFENLNIIDVFGNGGSPNYGIYAKTGSKVTNAKSGIIRVSGNGSYGFYAEANAEVKNEGIIIVDDGAIAKTDNVEDKNEEDTGGDGTQSVAFRLQNHSKIINNGKIISNSSMNFDNYHDGTGAVSIGKNGSFKAITFDGIVEANANITYDSFDKVFSNDDSFIGKDKGLKIVSGSYMFDTYKQINNKGNINVIMKMKNFENIIENEAFAKYLTTNYNFEKGNDIFNALKSSSDKNSFDATINKEFGYNVIPNLAKQSFDLEENINRDVNAEILNVSNQKDRTLINLASYKQKIDNNHYQDGYDEDVVFAYGLRDTKISEDLRFGYGLNVARAETDYDGGSSRYNNFIEIFAPLTYTNKSIFAMVKPKIGYAKGNIRRVADSGVYKANTEEFFYGMDTLVKYQHDLGFMDVEPTLGANITGLYQDNIKENNGGLNISSQNTVSVQSIIGLDVKKDININKEQSVLIKAGAKYIHEFGNKYKTSASVSDMIGEYDIVDNRLQRDYGLLDIKVQYNYNNFSVNVSAYAPLENNNKEYYMFGMGYRF